MKARLLAALAAAAVLAAGCGPGTNYKYRIAVIPKGLTHEFWQSIHRGADRAAADLGKEGLAVEILWDGPKKESDASEQINIIQTKANMGISGLVLAPQDSKADGRPGSSRPSTSASPSSSSTPASTRRPLTRTPT